MKGNQNKTRKVLIIGALPPPVHGVTLYISRLFKSDIPSKFRVIHFDISDHRDLKNIGRFDFINIILAIKCLIKLGITCYREKPDIGYLPLSWQKAGFIRDGLFILILKSIGRSKVVFHLPGSYFDTFYNHSSNWFKAFISFCLSNVDGAIVRSKRLKFIFAPWLANENIHVVYNGIDRDFITEPFVMAEKTSICVSYLGNLYPQKGVFEAIKAFAGASIHFPNLEFRIAGQWDRKDESYQQDINDYIKNKNLADRVKFLGPIFGMDKIQFLKDTDIFMFPSWNEGMPTVIIEAMAASCPIIATDTGAVPDMVFDGRNGFVLKVKDIKGLTEKLIYLLENPHIIEKMAKQSRTIFEEQFTSKKVFEDFWAVIEKYA